MRQNQRRIKQFYGSEGKTRTLFRLSACAVFCPTSSQPLGDPRDVSSVVTKGDGMNVEDILAILKTLGKPQTAAIYKRHGSGDNVYGVLTSEITKIEKKIKVDHALATELWDTGNADFPLKSHGLLTKTYNSHIIK